MRGAEATRAATGGLPANWRDLAALMAGSTLVGLMISFAAPLIALVLEAKGHGPVAIGLNAAVGGLGIFLLAPFLAPLLDRFGPIRLIQAGLCVVVLALALMPAFDHLAWWFLLRLVLGLGIALPFVLFEAAVNALAEDERRGRIIGVYGTLFCIGYAAGPALIRLTGTDGWTPFLLAAGVIVLAALPVGLACGADAAMAVKGEARLVSIARKAPLALITIFVFGACEVSLFSLFPVYGIATGLDGPAATLQLSLLLAGNALMQYPVGWLADRIDRRLIVALAAGLTLAGLVLLPFLPDGLLARLPVLLVTGGAMGALYTLSLILLGERFRGADLAVANTAFVMLFQIGAVIGPAAAGLAMAGFGPQGLIATLVLLLALPLARALRPPAPPERA